MSVDLSLLTSGGPIREVSKQDHKWNIAKGDVLNRYLTCNALDPQQRGYLSSLCYGNFTFTFFNKIQFLYMYVHTCPNLAYVPCLVLMSPERERRRERERLVLRSQ